MFENDNHMTYILKQGNISDTGHVGMKSKPNSNVDKRNKKNWCISSKKEV